MPLELVPPGRRKNNPFYLVRGTINGRDIEVSTKTRDETVARIFKNDLEIRLLKNRIPEAGEDVSFRRTAELYFEFKKLKAADQKRIQRLVDHIDPKGLRLVSNVVQADLVSAANTLYPAGKPETKNRWAIKPGAAIIHYAADNKWCAWERVKKFQEGPILTRAASDATAEAILEALRAKEAATPDTNQRIKTLERKKQLLILWLFRHWNRISDILRVDWDDLDLQNGLYRMYIGKKRVIREKPIDGEVLAMLANEPVKVGRVFPWQNKQNVYRWLRPLTKELGVKFTPHMARHYG